MTYILSVSRVQRMNQVGRGRAPLHATAARVPQGPHHPLSMDSQWR